MWSGTLVYNVLHNWKHNREHKCLELAITFYIKDKFKSAFIAWWLESFSLVLFDVLGRLRAMDHQKKVILLMKKKTLLNIDGNLFKVIVFQGRKRSKKHSSTKKLTKWRLRKIKTACKPTWKSKRWPNFLLSSLNVLPWTPAVTKRTKFGVGQSVK